MCFLFLIKNQRNLLANPITPRIRQEIPLYKEHKQLESRQGPMAWEVDRGYMGVTQAWQFHQLFITIVFAVEVIPHLTETP